jgi:Fic family protein
MELKDNLKQINDLQAKIKSFGKLNNELLRKIEYRFRLDWNFYSNNMEGNTLTRRETRTVMAGLLTVKDKPIKDVYEMNGHDNTIHKILKMAGGEMNVSESRIREIHLGIMFEEVEDRKKWVGEWKTVDNVVTNYKDEVFTFSSHLDVKEEIHALVNWLNAESDKIKAAKSGALHPVILAFEFHLRFLTIHPFYDGNGRVSRILMNIILLSFGFPAVIIRKEEGEETAYYRYLGDLQAYGAPPADYYSFMSGLVIRSQSLVLDAIDGKDITGPEDLDKEIALLKAELGGDSKEITIKYSFEVASSIVTNVFLPIVSRLLDKVSLLENLFLEKEEIFWLNNSGTSKGGISNFTARLIDLNLNSDMVRSIQFEVNLNGFKKAYTNTFGSTIRVSIKFDPYCYIVCSKDEKVKVTRLFDEHLSDAEINELVAYEIKSVMDQIRANTQKKD